MMQYTHTLQLQLSRFNYISCSKQHSFDRDLKNMFKIVSGIFKLTE